VHAGKAAATGVGPGLDDGVDDLLGDGLGDAAGKSEGVTDNLAVGNAPGDRVAWPIPRLSLPHEDRSTAPSKATANAARDAALTTVQTEFWIGALWSARARRHATPGV